MSITVVLAVGGKKDRVVRVLDCLDRELRRYEGGRLRIDEHSDPYALPEGADYGGEIYVEVDDAKDRAEASDHVEGLVNTCDPGRQVVAGGDI